MSKVEKKVIRNAFSRVRSVHPMQDFDSKIRVKREFAKETNINTIMERVKRGIMPPPWMTSKTPYYGDFSKTPISYQEAFEIVSRAEDQFESLPLEFRRAIDHDPRKIDQAPRELFERFGLLKKPEGSASASGASDAQVGQRVQGDRDLPGKAPPRANKGDLKSPPRSADKADEE